MLTFQERGPGSSIAKTENYKNKNISNKKYHCVFKNRGITCTTPVPSRKLAISLRLKIVFLSQEKTKSQQHPKGFPGGPPPQYWPGLSPLNFRVRMGSGVFDEVWPLAKTNDQTSASTHEVHPNSNVHRQKCQFSTAYFTTLLNRHSTRFILGFLSL